MVHCERLGEIAEAAEFILKNMTDSDNGARVLLDKCKLALEWVNETAVVGYYNNKEEENNATI